MSDLPVGHVYERDIVPDIEDSLSHVASLLEVPGPVLDVGTGTGALGRYLQSLGRSAVDGITHNPVEAERAKSAYRQIHVLDLTAADWSAALGEPRYRYIVCADVLEHLPEPERVLTQLLRLLADDGELIVSVPNVGYIGIVAELLAGHFEYSDEGLLDRTHLRFFTRESLTAMLSGAGLGISAWKSVERPLPASEFARQHIERLPTMVGRYLHTLPDALCYQFVLRAKPAAQPVQTEAPARFQRQAPQFAAQLFWTTAVPAQFTEQHSTTVFANIGESSLKLQFAIPPLHLPLTALRFDPADRPGMLRLQAMRLRNAGGELLWQHRPAVADLVQSAQIQAVTSGWSDPALHLTLLGDDPWFVIDGQYLPQGALADGGVLEVDMGWPFAPDAAWLGEQLVQLRQQKAEQQAVLHTTEQQRGYLLEMHETLESELAWRAEALADRDTRLMQMSDEVARLNAALVQSQYMLAAVKGSKLWRLGKRLRLTRIEL